MTAITESVLLLAGGGIVTVLAQALMAPRRDLFSRVSRLEDKVDRQGTDLGVACAMLESLRQHGIDLTREERP